MYLHTYIHTGHYIVLCKHINGTVIKLYQQYKQHFRTKKWKGPPQGLATEPFFFIGIVLFNRILLSILFLKSHLGITLSWKDSCALRYPV